MKNIFLAGFVSAFALVSPAFAAHNNPWASATDDLLAKKHDDNQSQSADTPGTDEMRGDMVQSGSDRTGYRNAGSGGGAGSKGKTRGGRGKR